MTICGTFFILVELSRVITNRIVVEGANARQSYRLDWGRNRGCRLLRMGLSTFDALTIYFPMSLLSFPWFLFVIVCASFFRTSLDLTSSTELENFRAASQLFLSTNNISQGEK